MLKYFFAIILFISTSLRAEEVNPSQVLMVDRILSLSINSSINPATYNYLKNGFEKSKSGGFDLILIKINTPGGLVSTTKDILTLFGESNLPIAIWIRPEGASATSAGAIIASGAHILAMSDGTNIGAATPVELGKDINQKDLKKKAINDLVALVTSLAQTRGRNAKGFEEMVSKAKSFNNREALKKNLIDGIANTPSEFKKLLQNKIVTIKGSKKTIELDPELETVVLNMDMGQKLLDVFADPNLAYILFLVGAALIYLELQAPGGFLAGGLGAIFMVLAGIGFQVLPLNLGALGLIVLSFILFVMEVYITSYGILTVAGLGSLIAGSMFLYRTDNAYLELSQSIVFSAVGAVFLFLLFIIFIITRDHKNIGKEGFNKLVGTKGKISKILDSDTDQHLYLLKVGGEVWKAKSEFIYQEGDWVTILDQDKEDIYLTI